MTPPPEDARFLKRATHEKRSTVKRTPDDMRHRRARLRARLSAYRDTALLLTSPFGRIYRRLKT
jgi:hypothetical protein